MALIPHHWKFTSHKALSLPKPEKPAWADPAKMSKIAVFTALFKSPIHNWPYYRLARD